MSKDQIERIVQCYKDGVSIPDIALKTNLSTSTIKRWIKNNRHEHDLEYRRGSIRYRKDRAEHSAEQSPWNVSRSLDFLIMNWKAQ